MSFTLSKVNACLGLSILLAPGCASIKSDMVTRDESNQCWEVRHLTGVPVTVRLVTHLRVEIIESHYLKSDGTPVASVVGREVKHTPISTPKIFTVDFKRPAAGYLKYNATFTDEQSLTALRLRRASRPRPPPPARPRRPLGSRRILAVGGNGPSFRPQARTLRER